MTDSTESPRTETRISRRRFLQGAGAAGGLGLLGALESSPAQAAHHEDDMHDPIVIGANHPLTGFLARSGQGMTNAARLACMHVNQDGGIQSLGGTKLKFVNRDNKAKQELGGEVQRQLIEDDGATLTIGCFSSPVTLSATQVTERRGVPHIIDVSVADRILQARPMNYTYRIQTPARGMARDYARFMPAIAAANDKKMETASLVYLDNAFGQSMRNNLRKFLPQNNVELVEEVAYSFGQESMDTEATRIKQVDADAFVFVGYGGGGIRMMNSLQNVAYRPPLLTGTSTPTFTDQDVVVEIGKYANCGFGNNYEFNYNLKWTDRIFADYRLEYGRPLGITHAVMSYTAVVVAAAALEKAGSRDPEKINQALKTLRVENHPAAMGPIVFDEQGENKNAMSPMLQVQKLSPVLVWPKQYAQSQPNFDDCPS